MSKISNYQLKEIQARDMIINQKNDRIEHMLAISEEVETWIDQYFPRITTAETLDFAKAQAECMYRTVKFNLILLESEDYAQSLLTSEDLKSIPLEDEKKAA